MISIEKVKRIEGSSSNDDLYALCSHIEYYKETVASLTEELYANQKEIVDLNDRLSSSLNLAADLEDAVIVLDDELAVRCDIIHKVAISQFHYHTSSAFALF